MDKRPSRSKVLMAFSLLEVMVAVGILAGLGVALIEAQVNNLGLLQRFNQNDPAKHYIQQQILSFETNPMNLYSFPESGRFGDDSTFAGKSWELLREDRTIYGFPVVLVTYSILSPTEKGSQKVSGWIFTASPDSSSQDWQKLLSIVPLN